VTSGIGSSGTGNLNVNGGAATFTGNITKTTAIGTGTITVNNASLAVQGRIGSVAIPVDNLNLSDANLTLAASATLTNVVVINLTTGGSTNIINVSSVPAVTAYPMQIPLIAYAGAIGGAGFDNNVGLGTLPGGSPAYTGYLSNNTATLTVDLVLTGGPAPAQPITWSGAQSGDWDTTTLNWLVGASPTNYNNAGDFVTFDDTASVTTVNLVTTTLTPGSLTVTNTAPLTYAFVGSGKLSGSTGLTKKGTGTLVISNNVANDFSGGISVEGTLAFDQSVNVTHGNSVSGPGA
jgi:autotransporter-associated beta strand protein